MGKLLDYMDEEVVNIIKKNNRLSDLKDLTIDLKNPEINIKEIAEKLGCEVNYEYLFSEIGSYNEETKKITVNLFDPEYRQRFTLAHELAHHLLGHKGINYRGREINKDRIIHIINERKANNLAANMLMPRKIIEKLILLVEEKDDRIVKLAEKLNVSYVAMEFRLKSLGYI